MPRRIHARLEIGSWWVQIGRTPPDVTPEQSSPPVDTPPPQTLWAPEYVGFVRIPDPTE